MTKIAPQPRLRATRAPISTLGVVLAFLVVGCSSAGESTQSPSPSALPSTLPSGLPSALPSAPPSGASPSPTAVAPTEFPSCNTVLSPSGFAVVATNHLVLAPVAPGPGGLNDFERLQPPLRAIATSGANLTCWFIVPASERGMVLSIVRVSAAERATIVATLGGGGYSAIDVGSPVGDHSGFQRTVPGDYPYTEAHALFADIWVSCFDYFGQSATVYALDALTSVDGHG